MPNKNKKFSASDIETLEFPEELLCCMYELFNVTSVEEIKTEMIKSATNEGTLEESIRLFELLKNTLSKFGIKHLSNTELIQILLSLAFVGKDIDDAEC